HGVGASGDDGQLGAGDGTVEVDGVFEGDQVVVADQDQGGRLDPGQVVGGEGRLGAPHVDDLPGHLRPVAGAVRCHGLVEFPEEGHVGALGSHPVQHGGVRPALGTGPEVRPDDHQGADQVGPGEGDQQGDDAAVAPSDQVGGPVDDRVD